MDANQTAGEERIAMGQNINRVPVFCFSSPGWTNVDQSWGKWTNWRCILTHLPIENISTSSQFSTSPIPVEHFVVKLLTLLKYFPLNQKEQVLWFQIRRKVYSQWSGVKGWNICARCWAVIGQQLAKCPQQMCWYISPLPRVLSKCTSVYFAVHKYP